MLWIFLFGIMSYWGFKDYKRTESSLSLFFSAFYGALAFMDILRLMG